MGNLIAPFSMGLGLLELLMACNGVPANVLPAGTGGAGNQGGASATGGSTSTAPIDGGADPNTAWPNGTAKFPFPQGARSANCIYPAAANNDDVVTAYNQWEAAVVTADGASGYLRIKKPDSGTSTTPTRS